MYSALKSSFREHQGEDVAEVLSALLAELRIELAKMEAAVSQLIQCALLCIKSATAHACSVPHSDAPMLTHLHACTNTQMQKPAHAHTCLCTRKCKGT